MARSASRSAMRRSGRRRSSVREAGAGGLIPRHIRPRPTARQDHARETVGTRPSSGALAARQDLVDEAVVARLLGRHEAVALGVSRDLLDGLPGVLGVELVQHAALLEDLARQDLDLGGLALKA